MQIASDGISKDGIIDEKYGKYSQYTKLGMPTHSLPIKIENVPDGTISFALILDDPDSQSVCGYTWIHWLVANLTKTKIEAGESEMADQFIQGMNSWHENCYGGPCPPDKAHKYRIRVYALNSMLNLKGNFTEPDLLKAMEGKIIDSAEIFGIYKIKSN